MLLKYMSGNILFKCYQLITSDPIPILSVAAVAVKLLIEQITRYCTVMLRSLQGEPCLTFHLNTVIVTRLIDKNTFWSATAHTESHPYYKTPEDRSI